MIAYVLDTFPRLTETFVLREIEELRRRGVSPLLIALRRGSTANLSEETNNLLENTVFAPPLACPLTLAKLAAESVKNPIRSVHLIGAFVANLQFGVRFAVQRLKGALRALALRKSVKAASRFHAHFAYVAADLAEGLSDLTGKPWSVSVHAWDVFAQSRAILERRVAAADRIFTCSSRVNDHLATGSPASRDRLVLCRHGVDVERFTPSPLPSADKFLAVGRLFPKKGFDTLIEACARCRRQNVTFTCDIIGDGPERENLERLITARDLNGVVELRGAASLETIIESHRDHLALIAPCRPTKTGDVDGVPNVILEAQAMARPVVSTPVGGVSEFIEDGVNGLLVPADDPDRLAAAMNSLLADRSLAERLGRNGRKMVIERFAIEETIKPLWEHFQADETD